MGKSEERTLPHPGRAARLAAFGALLKRHRRAAGLTQEDLAARAGVSVYSVSNLERGVGHVPRPSTLRLLADALGLDSSTDTAFKQAVWDLDGARSSDETAFETMPEAALEAVTVAAPQDGSQSPRIQIPSPPSPLIGREDDLRAALELVDYGAMRLLTFVGAPGVGKTHLALEVAERCVERFRYGVVFVSLASVPVSEQAPGVIARALGIPYDGESLNVEGADALGARASAVLRDRRLLLVLDNCEHLPDLAPALAGLLAACPALRILATSRVPLHLRAEQLFDVAPLAVPADGDAPSVTVETMAMVPAVACFMARARATRRDFALSTANMGDVAAICRQLDGLPLALELAAPHLRSLTTGELLRRLEQRLPHLAEGPRDLPQRQRSLRAAFDWSYELLTPPTRAVLRWLGAFRGGASMEALTAVAATCAGASSVSTSPQLLREVEELVSHNLVRRAERDQSEPRAFDSTSDKVENAGVRLILLETVREYAEMRLTSAGAPEERAVRDAHATWCLGLAERAAATLGGPEQAWWLECLNLERANWHTALTWALQSHQTGWGLRLTVALGPYWYIRGEAREGRAWLEQLLGLTDTPDEAAERAGHMTQMTTHASYRMQALHEAAKLAYRQGDYAQAQAWLEASAALARDLGDQRSLTRALNGLGNIAINRGDFVRASSMYTDAVRVARREGNITYVASVLNNLGSVAHEQGKYDDALAAYEESAGLLRAGGHSRNLAAVLVNLSEVVCEQGDYARAIALCRESLTLRQTLHDQWGVAFVKSKLAEVACADGRYADATRLCEESLVQLEREADRRGIADVLTCQGRIAQAQGTYARAAACHERSLALRRELGVAHGAALSHAHLGHVARDLGDWQRTIQQYRVALQSYRRLGVARGLAPLLEGLALLACLRYQLRRGRWLMERAESMRAAFGVTPTSYERCVRERIRALLDPYPADGALA